MPASGERKIERVRAPSQQEVGAKRNGSAKLDVEALVREAYEAMKAKIEEVGFSNEYRKYPRNTATTPSCHKVVVFMIVFL